MLILLKLKEIISRPALLCLLFVAPVIFGYISSYASSGETPLRIAVVDNENSAFSREYISILESCGLELIITGEDKANELLEMRKAEGLLEIKSSFEQAVRDKKGKPLEYRAAVGVSTTALVSEQLSLGVTRMRAFLLYSDAVGAVLSEAGKREVFGRNADAKPVLYLSGDEAAFPSGLFVSPTHGAAALFMSLSALFTAVWLGAREPLPRLFGKRAWLRHYFSSLAAVLLVWAAQLAVYLLSSFFLYEGFDAGVWLAFVGFLAYCAGLGAAASCVLRDGKTAVYLYAPFFLLNMTVGGALWLQPADNVLVKLVAPAAFFIEASKGSGAALAVLFAGGAAMAVIPAVIYVIRRPSRAF